MNFARGLRILLAVLLLSAQHAAVSHQIWHFGDHGSQHSEGLLCEQHDALGTVAGAMDSALAIPPGDAPVGFAFDFIGQASATPPGSAPSSRGPPALL